VNANTNEIKTVFKCISHIPLLNLAFNSSQKTNYNERKLQFVLMRVIAKWPLLFLSFRGKAKALMWMEDSILFLRHVETSLVL